jgi:hypothetical protein
MGNELSEIGNRYGLNPVEYGAVGDGIANDAVPMQALLDRLATGRGGKLCLPPGKFRLPVPLRIKSKSISIDGGANGFSNSPNAEHESLTGSEIFSEGNAFEIGNHEPVDISRGVNKLGGLSFRDLYLWGPGVTSGSKGLYFDQHTDQAQFINIHLGSYQWGLHSDTVLDVPTFTELYVTHCQEAVHFSEKSLAAYVKFQHCTIADNDGTGVFIHPASNSFCCQLTHCVIVRNARTEVTDGCNVYWGAREGIIANNIIHAGGYHFYNEAVLGCKDNHVMAHGVIIDGSDNMITSNQILDHAMGVGIIVKGNRNQISHNSFTGSVGSCRGEGFQQAAVCRNQVDIRIEVGSCDTVITQPGHFTLVDEGTRTIVNGISKNEGDPDFSGDWKGRDKPDGLLIYDCLNNKPWKYGRGFPQGRMAI